MSEIKLNPSGKVALVSGANRGIGRAIVVELINRGASKVYAGARNTEKLTSLVAEFGDKVVPVELDVTSQESVDQAAAQIDHLDILVNNAGRLELGGVIAPDVMDSLKANMDVNVWGLLRLTNAVSRHLTSNEPAAIVNVSSLAGLGNMPFGATYSVSKAAVHSITQGMRAELIPNNTLVVGVYPGPIDTDMTTEFEMDKDSPSNVAKNVVDGIEHGVEDVFPDAMSAQVGPFYGTNPKAVEQQFATMVG